MLRSPSHFRPLSHLPSLQRKHIISLSHLTTNMSSNRPVYTYGDGFNHDFTDEVCAPNLNNDAPHRSRTMIYNRTPSCLSTLHHLRSTASTRVAGWITQAAAGVISQGLPSLCISVIATALGSWKRGSRSANGRAAWSLLEAACSCTCNRNISLGGTPASTVEPSSLTRACETLISRSAKSLGIERVVDGEWATIPCNSTLHYS